MSTALLFDHREVDEVDWSGSLPRLGRSAVLWIDLEGPDDGELERLADVLDLDSRAIERRENPEFADYGDHIQITASAPNESRTLVTVTCLVSKRWVVTIHEEPVEMLETFRERAAGSGATGQLDGLEFLANLLEWAIESYFHAFEEIEASLEEIDTRAMSGDVEEREDVVEKLVERRREIGRLRRALTSHREAILALTRPELEAIATSSSAARFSELRGRLEEAVQAARDSREAVVGAFDVIIASTGQRTNEIMKFLTLASVLLLPGTLIAGVMGMNFKLGVFETAAYFWLVLAAMLVVALVTLAIARMRDWI
ncbi:MAG TPA: CorA family divalent cation transporter [Gaiellaceae bacterium]|nr:CorA family divalent cation transporter [Gaiellaceae bacterium]